LPFHPDRKGGTDRDEEKGRTEKRKNRVRMKVFACLLVPPLVTGSYCREKRQGRRLKKKKKKKKKTTFFSFFAFRLLDNQVSETKRAWRRSYEKLSLVSGPGSRLVSFGIGLLGTQAKWEKISGFG